MKERKEYSQRLGLGWVGALWALITAHALVWLAGASFTSFVYACYCSLGRAAPNIDIPFTHSSSTLFPISSWFKYTTAVGIATLDYRCISRTYICKRAEPESPTIKLGSLVMDLERHTVVDGGQEVKLSAKEFLLLQYLLQHRGRVLSRDVLLGDVWGYRYTGGTRTVDVHVRRLREKLPVLVDALVTVKQFGYKLDEQ